MRKSGRRASTSKRGEEGSGTVEAVVLVPVAMVTLFFVLQACLWAHAANLVSAGAAEGVQAASVDGGSPTAASATARSLLAASGRNVVTGVTVLTTTAAGGQVEVKVSGRAETLLPWLHLSVSSTRRATIQEFREVG